MNPEPTPATPTQAGFKFSMTMADVLVASAPSSSCCSRWGTHGQLRHLGRPAPTRCLSHRPAGHAASGPDLRPLGIFVILATLLLLATALVDTWWKRDEAKVGVNRHHLQVGLALFVLVDIFGMGLSGGSGVVHRLGRHPPAARRARRHRGCGAEPLRPAADAIGDPECGAKPAPTYPPAGYVPPQGAPVDPAAPTAQMPAQDPNNPTG